MQSVEVIQACVPSNEGGRRKDEEKQKFETVQANCPMSVSGVGLRK